VRDADEFLNAHLGGLDYGGIEFLLFGIKEPGLAALGQPFMNKIGL
jgi:hypothetical protein